MASLHAADYRTIGGIRYLVNSNNHTVAVAPLDDYGKNYYTGHIVIPEKVNIDGIDYTVVAFAQKCFSGCENLLSIVIPSSVKSFGQDCFSNCTSLTSFNIPSSVTSIGEGCFSFCTSLKAVNIPSSLTYLEGNCFSGCSSLESINIPTTVNYIGRGCFYGCEALKSLVIPSSVTSIGDECFVECSSLTSIEIPPLVTSLSRSCFLSCISLESVIIPSSVTNIDERCFAYCSSLKTINIPSPVTTIGEQCFSHCDSLRSITIPSSMTSLGRYCFMNCDSLKSIYCYCKPLSINYQYFGIPLTATIYVPSRYYSDYRRDSQWGKYTIIAMPNDEEQDEKRCETPIITFSDGKLHFASATTGANYHYTVSCSDVTSEAYSEDGNVSLVAAYTITAYATADGYSPSDKTTATLYWVDGRLESPTSVTATAAKRGVIVSTDGGRVTLSGLDDGETVSFYTIGGGRLGTVTASHGVATASFSTGQIIVAKIGTTGIKVAL